MADKPTEPATGADEDEAGLPRPVQEHIGRQLRTAYNTLEQKPAFLGDDALPSAFEPHILRLMNRETLRDRGVEAVRRALERDDPAG